MTDTNDLLIQNLRRENEALRAELEWTGKEIVRSGCAEGGVKKENDKEEHIARAYAADTQIRKNRRCRYFTCKN